MGLDDGEIGWFHPIRAVIPINERFHVPHGLKRCRVHPANLLKEGGVAMRNRWMNRYPNSHEDIVMLRQSSRCAIAARASGY